MAGVTGTCVSIESLSRVCIEEEPPEIAFLATFSEIDNGIYIIHNEQLLLCSTLP